MQLRGRGAALFVAAALATVACSQSREAANQTQQGNATNTEDQREDNKGGGERKPRDQGDENSGNKPSSDVVSVKVTGGDVRASEDPVDVSLGERVTIAVTSDVADEIHVHGYNVLKEARPGRKTTLSFVADIPGAFEVELEESGLLLLEIRVR